MQTPGWHGWVRDLAYNEGDVPQLLPVSDACLNQEWREKLTWLAKKVTAVVKADVGVCFLRICGCLSGYLNDSESLV